MMTFVCQLFYSFVRTHKRQTKSHHTMTPKRKIYESPTSEVLEMKMQGMLCDSPSHAALLLFATDMDVTYGSEDWTE